MQLAAIALTALAYTVAVLLRLCVQCLPMLAATPARRPDAQPHTPLPWVVHDRLPIIRNPSAACTGPQPHPMQTTANLLAIGLQVQRSHSTRSIE